MKNRLILLMCCLFLMFQVGCIPKTQFGSVNNEYLLAIKQCNKTLNSQIKKNQTEKKSLAGKIEKLNQTLKEKETIISIQETVIRLFDDSEQTLQSSIQAQLAIQKIGVN